MALTKTRGVLFAGALALAAGPTAPDGAPVRVATAAPSIEASAAPGLRVARAPHEAANAELCEGALDVVTGPRPMTHAEREACARAGRPAFEVPIGYEALVVVTPDDVQMIDSTTAKAHRSAGGGKGGRRRRRLVGRGADAPPKSMPSSMAADTPSLSK